MMNNPKKRENEQAFLIAADNLSEAIQEIVEADTLGHFTLGEPVVHNIKDVYFDTPDNDLRSSKVTLRKRILDGETLISFKGIEKNDKKETQDHNEWEFAWPFKYLGIHPEALFDVAGLSETQQRETTRISREVSLIYQKEDGDEVVEDFMRIGELNIDSSIYTFSTGSAKMFEVEFERDPEAPKTIKMKNLVQLLVNEFPFLKPWNHGKFATGKAVEFAFGVKTNDDGILDLTSFDSISDMFDLLTVTQTYDKIKIAK